MLIAQKWVQYLKEVGWLWAKWKKVKGFQIHSEKLVKFVVDYGCKYHHIIIFVRPIYGVDRPVYLVDQ